MKAIVTTQYGDAEVLLPQDVVRPVVEDDDVLVQICAASVNPIDWKVRKGEFKFLTGRTPPRILGNDYAGIVVDVDKCVTSYRPGDEVWGFVEAFDRGTYAEFVAVKEEEMGPKPARLSFEEAASLPTVGLTAYQALVHEAGLEEGDHILINGASGGVGLAAVQIAKALGATVTGVCSTRNIQITRDMGADDVIDYTREDVLGCRSCYDVFFDVVSNKSFGQAKDTLKPGGVYVRTLPSFESLALAPVINLFSTKKVRTLDCKASAEDLATLREMADVGTLAPVIENVYRLEDVREAHRRSETGRVVGKLVLEIISSR